MSFSEKLVQLRKSNKMSQEQLADLLDVTRQSVSKWESGQTYPEMDKLLAMCKIFKCSLDDLTNDEVTTIKIEEKKKGNLNNFVDSILEFIEKTYHMFEQMKFSQMIKCFFVMGCIALGLLILRIPFNFLESSIYHLLSSFGTGIIVSAIIGLFDFMFDICFFVLYVFIFIYLFKLIYLDTYKEVKVSVEESKEKISESKEMEHSQVTIERKDKSYVFFDILGTGIILFIKGMICCFSIPFVISLFLMSAAFMIALVFFFHGVFYFGIFFGIIFAIILNILILEVVFNFVMNRKSSMKRLLLTFFIGLIGLGLSFGIFMVECANTKFINEAPATEKKETVEKRVTMTEDLMVPHYMEIAYQVDESLQDQVLVNVEYYKNYSKASFPEENSLYFYMEGVDENLVLTKIVHQVMTDLSHKTVYNYHKLFEAKVTVIATSENINKMKENAKRKLEEQERVEEENEINMYERKIGFLQEENDRLIEENGGLQQKIAEQQVQIEDYQAKIQEYKENLKSLLEE